MVNWLIGFFLIVNPSKWMGGLNNRGFYFYSFVPFYMLVCVWFSVSCKCWHLELHAYTH